MSRSGRAKRIAIGAGGLALLACLLGCSPAADDPSAVTPDEDRQLNAAAAQLDANRLAPVDDTSTNESSQP